MSQVDLHTPNQVEGNSSGHDQELLARFRAGEEAGFKAVFNRFYGSILYYARDYLRRETDAEDIVQEIFVSLWKKRLEFNSFDHIKSFLYKATRFSCIDQLR